MDSKQYCSKIRKLFQSNGFGDIISEESANKFCALSEFLIEANKTTNLTAITDESEIMLKHFLDSAIAVNVIPKGAHVIDIGCGAGFPSLPIAILRDDITITALDSTGKKVAFVQEAAKELSLSNVMPICARAEEFAKEHRESFDVATSRAVARLNVLAELCLPLVKIGGIFIAMKGSKGLEEHNEAMSGIKQLGADFKVSCEDLLSGDSEAIERQIYVYSKSRQTPKQFPRKYAQIVKKPL